VFAKYEFQRSKIGLMLMHLLTVVY